MHDMLGKLRWDDFIDGIVTSMITHLRDGSEDMVID